MHDEFINSVFGTKVPMSSTEQKETFADTLTDTLENECSFDVVQSVHEKIRERITIHKESKDPEPMDFDAGDVSLILKAGGVPTEVCEAFEEKCTERFGDDATLNPENIINSKKFEIQTPQIKIVVASSQHPFTSPFPILHLPLPPSSAPSFGLTAKTSLTSSFPPPIRC